MNDRNESNKDGAVAVVRMRASELRKRARAARRLEETEILEHDQGSLHPHCVLPPYFFDRALHALKDEGDRSGGTIQSD